MLDKRLEKSVGRRAQCRREIGVLISRGVGGIDRCLLRFVSDRRGCLIPLDNRSIQPRTGGLRRALGGLLGLLGLDGRSLGTGHLFGQHFIAGISASRQHRGRNGQQHRSGGAAAQESNELSQRGTPDCEKQTATDGIAQNHLDFLNPGQRAQNGNRMVHPDGS